MKKIILIAIIVLIASVSIFSYTIQELQGIYVDVDCTMLMELKGDNLAFFIVNNPKAFKKVMWNDWFPQELIQNATSYTKLGMSGEWYVEKRFVYVTEGKLTFKVWFDLDAEKNLFYAKVWSSTDGYKKITMFVKYYGY